MRNALLVMIFALIGAAQNSQAATEYANCMTPVSEISGQLLQDFYAKSTGKSVKASVMGIYGGGIWTNKNFPSDNRGESVAYSTYTLSFILDVNGGRGAANGYRLDPMVEVRVNAGNCSDVRRVILLHLNSDVVDGDKLGPALGASFPILNQSSVQIYKADILPDLVNEPFDTDRDQQWTMKLTGKATVDQNGLGMQSGVLEQK